MSKDTEGFLRIVEDIRTQINRRVGMAARDGFGIDEAAKSDPVVLGLIDKLHYFRQIRNLLQHPRHDTPTRPFLITPEFLSEVQSVLDLLTEPPRAKSLGVGRKQLTFARVEDRIGALARLMKKECFSHLPIVDGDFRVLGVFNEAAVFSGLCTDQELILDGSMCVGDMMGSCRLDAGHTETFDFVAMEATKDELLKRFVVIESEFTRIGAIFVTKNGKPNEPLQRMITAWDVLSHFHGVSRPGT